MTTKQIDELRCHGIFPEKEIPLQLIETHISWVIICKLYTYKIKKPIVYPFLDFSSVEKRHRICHQEVILNARLSGNMYIDVLSVTESSGALSISNTTANIIDYAVRMHTMDRGRQMDVLLEKNMVSSSDMIALAKKIADFHQSGQPVYLPAGMNVQKKFAELEEEIRFLKPYVDAELLSIIHESIWFFDDFMHKNGELLIFRLKAGFCRDFHGDLYTRNIFLLPEPVPFDCIEFNAEFRQIDILNEVAFLCMDLDAFGRHDLSEVFITEYNKLFPTMDKEKDKQLFFYYKCYRANVRAKVNSLRARSAENGRTLEACIMNVEKYLKLMRFYLEVFPLEFAQE